LVLCGPAQGTPKKLVHRVEPEHLDSLPGTKETYSAWRELNMLVRAGSAEVTGRIQTELVII